MRTTLNIDDRMLRKATEITGVKEKTSFQRHRSAPFWGAMGRQGPITQRAFRVIRAEPEIGVGDVREGAARPPAGYPENNFCFFPPACLR